MDIINITIWIIALYLAADFVSGIFHWLEDKYWSEHWPIIGEYIVTPNILHHTRPAACTQGTYWTRNNTTLIPTIFGILMTFWWCWQLAVFFAILSQAAETHVWSHIKCSRPIRFLQQTGILLSPKQHNLHHRIPFNDYYCGMTGFLNPILSKIRFWYGLECALKFITFGYIKPLPERARI